MAQQKFSGGDIQGWSPAVDPTQSDKVFVIDGTNFSFDSSGPQSNFGDRLLLPHPRRLPNYMQGVRLYQRKQNLQNSNRCFHIDGDGIWEWDEKVGGYQLIYNTPDTTMIPHRWTSGFLAGIMYFCHPRVGILCYDLAQGICIPHTLVGTATPANALAITVNNGRLCVLDPLLFSWSNPSDGLDFTPALGGGGFQVLTDRVSGDPITLTSYTAGCLTWTTSGVMRSEFTGDASVFRHRSLNTDYKPANSFCTARVDDDNIIILDERGLFQSKGGASTVYGPQFTPYSPLFNEFLIDYIGKNKLNQGNQLRLEWDEIRRFLYVSVMLNPGSNTYDTAFCYYANIDKWGKFTGKHKGIIPFQINDSLRQGNYQGFVGQAGFVRYWQESPNREQNFIEAKVQLGSRSLYYPVIQHPMQFGAEDIGQVMGSAAKASGFSRSAQKTVNGILLPPRAGFYSTYVMDTTTPGTFPSFSNTWVPAAAQLKGLSASITLGLFRPLGPQSVDELSEVINVLIRSLVAQDPAVTGYFDRETESGTDDYQSESGVNDYDPAQPDSYGFQLTVTSTLDGVTTFLTQSADLTVFTPGASYYSCSVNGLWHYLTITANNVGESFHITILEITAVSAGRML